jgi:hypothetical protein
MTAAAVLAGSLWMLRWATTEQQATGDTFWYTRQAATIAGQSLDQAEQLALRVTCKHGRPGYCDQAALESLSRVPDRYARIFETRPGYPLLAAPFVATFGEQGMVVATAMLGVSAGVLVAAVLRLLGGSAVQSLFATALLFLLPTGYWISRLMSEAAVVAAALATLCAVTIVLRDHWSRRAKFVALGAVAAGLIAATATKPASGVLLAAAVGAAAALLIGVGFVRGRRVDRALVALAGVCAAVVAAWQGLTIMLDLPGLRETLQDMFTRHFTRPDVPDPMARLVELNEKHWPAQLDKWLNSGAPLAVSTVLALLLVGLYVALRTLPPRDALVWLAVGASGLVTVALHPIWTEVDRLMIFAWLPVTVAVALVARHRGQCLPGCDDFD